MFGIFSRFVSRAAVLPQRPVGNAAAACMEPLEGRQLMSATITLVAATGQLNVIGTDAADAAAVTVDARGTSSTSDDLVRVRVTTGTQVVSRTLARSAVRSIQFSGLAGNDSFTNDAGIRSTALGGAGNDTLTGGSANDLLVGESGNDRLFGRGGSDRLEGGSGDDFLDTGNDFSLFETSLGQSGRDTFRDRLFDITDRVSGEPLV